VCEYITFTINYIQGVWGIGCNIIAYIMGVAGCVTPSVSKSKQEAKLSLR